MLATLATMILYTENVTVTGIFSVRPRRSRGGFYADLNAASTVELTKERSASDTTASDGLRHELELEHKHETLERPAWHVIIQSNFRDRCRICEVCDDYNRKA